MRRVTQSHYSGEKQEQTTSANLYEASVRLCVPLLRDLLELGGL